MPYCPYRDLSGRANVIISGTPTAQTSLLISPFNKDDKLTVDCETSTAIVYHILRKDSLPLSLLASSDCFSVDALTAIFAMTEPEKFIDPDILQQIAATALYERAAEQDITRTVFVLNSWMDPIRSPLNARIFHQKQELSNVLFEELLPRLPKIIEKVDYLERYWLDEEQKLEMTDDLLQSGLTELQEVENLDLAIFSIPMKEVQEDGRLFHLTGGWEAQLHPISLHSRTSCSRILLQAGQESCFYFRADSLATCNRALVPGRKNLSGLADILNSREQEAKTWICDPLQSPRATIKKAQGMTSRISSSDFQKALTDFLAVE